MNVPDDDRKDLLRMIQPKYSDEYKKILARYYLGVCNNKMNQYSRILSLRTKLINTINNIVCDGHAAVFFNYEGYQCCVARLNPYRIEVKFGDCYILVLPVTYTIAFSTVPTQNVNELLNIVVCLLILAIEQFSVEFTIIGEDQIKIWRNSPMPIKYSTLKFTKNGVPIGLQKPTTYALVDEN